MNQFGGCNFEVLLCIYNIYFIVVTVICVGARLILKKVMLVFILNSRSSPERWILSVQLATNKYKFINADDWGDVYGQQM